ncbi:MAG: hypothetical protein KF833_01855 [Verrucomicrobiae bacterium]|nr:hypothetical protein [Verrucomicrobiae bacterium]
MKMVLMKVEDVDPVANFGSPSKGQNLVHCGIPEIQAPSQLRVGFDRKEPEGTVEGPFDSRLV